MAQSRPYASSEITGTPSDVAEIEDLLAKVFCTCSGEVGTGIGAVACELFRKVDVEGQPLEAAADGMGLDPRDAVAILAVFRQGIADALVEDISSGSNTVSRK